MTHISQNELQNIPIIVEFVAVPNTFDIDYYLSMRESTGNFSNKEMDMKHITFISDTIKSTPYFVLSRAPELTIASCLFCLEIYRDIGLTLDSVSDLHEDSKFRGRDFKREMKWNYKQKNSRRGQAPLCIVVVNVYEFIQSGLLRPVIEKIVEIEDYAVSVEEKMEMVKEYQKK